MVILHLGVERVRRGSTNDPQANAGALCAPQSDDEPDVFHVATACRIQRRTVNDRAAGPLTPRDVEAPARRVRWHGRCTASRILERQVAS